MNVPAFIRMKHLKCLDKTMSFLNIHTILLCLKGHVCGFVYNLEVYVTTYLVLGNYI